jgi:hypothetical protein
MTLRWFRRAAAQASKNPRSTRDLSPEGLGEAAKRRDLFELLELFLVRRVESELQLEEKRAEVRLKSAEADAQTKLKLEEIRAQRRQLRATQAAERNRTHPRDAQGRIMPNPRAIGGCPVCVDPGSPYLTVDQIRVHHALGHANGSISAGANPAVSNKPTTS